MSTINCNTIIGGPARDKSFHSAQFSRFSAVSGRICNLNVEDLASNTINTEDLDVNNLSVNNLTVNQNLDIDLFVNGDIGQSQFINNTLTLPGTGGIQTESTAPDIMQITDLRNLTPFVVSQDAIPDNPGEFSSITDALDAAEAAVSPNPTAFAVVYIKEGLYQESFTMRNKVFIAGLGNSAVVGTVTITPSSSVASPGTLFRVNVLGDGTNPILVIDGDGGLARGLFENCSMNPSVGVEGVIITDSNGGVAQAEFYNSQINIPDDPNPPNTVRFEGSSNISFLAFFGKNILNGKLFVNQSSPLTEANFFSNFNGDFIIQTPNTNAGIINMISCGNESATAWTVPQYDIQGGLLNMVGCNIIRGEFVIGGTGTILSMNSCTWEGSSTDTPVVVSGTGCLVELTGNRIRHTSGGAALINVGAGNTVRAIGNMFEHNKTDLIIGAGTYDQPVNGAGPAGNCVVGGGSSTVTAVTNPITMV